MGFDLVFIPVQEKGEEVREVPTREEANARLQSLYDFYNNINNSVGSSSGQGGNAGDSTSDNGRPGITLSDADEDSDDYEEGDGDGSGAAASVASVMSPRTPESNSLRKSRFTNY